MAVRVAGPGRRDRDAGPDGVDERLRRRGLAAVMGDLEQVDLGQAFGQELWVDVLLDVAHQQEAAQTDLAEQHDRHVVDPGATVGRLGGYLAADRPEDP
jgi:hypothetical protein